MMVLTHVAVGLALAVPVALVAPEYALAAAIGGGVGGFVPDLDLLAGEHRKTLHFPVLSIPPAVAAAIVAVLAPSPPTVGLAVGTVAFAVHSASDALGAGEELRPWERTNPDAVYDHRSGRWLRARYLVPYDGHPIDLLVTTAALLPVVLVYDGPVRWIAGVMVGLATVYTTIRKYVPAYVAPLVE